MRTRLWERFRTLDADAMRDDVPGYTCHPTRNVFEGLDHPDIWEDLRGGDGSELVGDVPKFCAVHSSSALAVNAFGPFRIEPSRFRFSGMGGFTEAAFEKKLPTGLRGNSPNLDFFVAGPEGAVAVESKFTEMLGRKRAKFSAAYDSAIERLAEPAWEAMYHSLKADPTRFIHLDAGQLVKHYLGVRHSLADHPGRKVLFYVFWEPEGAEEDPVFVRHREEVATFSGDLGGGEVEFVAMAYSELWTRWEAGMEWEGIGGHVGRLRGRYG